MVRTLSERSQALISDSDDRQEENAHVENTLRSCGYPDWTFQKVRKQLTKTKPSKRKRNRIQVTDA